LIAPAPLLAGSAAASAARTARAEVKRQVRFSGESLRWVLSRCQEPGSEYLRRMPVLELLAAMPGVGAQRAAEMADIAGISPSRRLGGLGPHQIEALAALIDQRAARRSARPANQ